MLIREVAVKTDGREYAEPGNKEGGDASLPVSGSRTIGAELAES
jgi:hypothetical protein